jgi:hypothetical protein
VLITLAFWKFELRSFLRLGWQRAAYICALDGDLLPDLS